MGTTVSRRSVIAGAGLGLAGAAWFTPRAHAAPDTGDLWPSFPHQNPEKVREMVGVCHRDVLAAGKLLLDDPALANAAWDWGFGDWETALGAAAHTGRREIAELLLKHGARLDIFAAASLGYTAVVKAMVEAHPGIQRTWGPHGIPLAAHARAGGEKARETLEYLVSLGDADSPPPSQPTTKEERAVYIGSYVYDKANDLRLEVRESTGWLEVTKGKESGRRLNSTGNHTFFPAGVPTCTLTFEVKNGAPKMLLVDIGSRRVFCDRV